MVLGAYGLTFQGWKPGTSGGKCPVFTDRGDTDQVRHADWLAWNGVQSGLLVAHYTTSWNEKRFFARSPSNLMLFGKKCHGCVPRKRMGEVQRMCLHRLLLMIKQEMMKISMHRIIIPIPEERFGCWGGGVVSAAVSGCAAGVTVGTAGVAWTWRPCPSAIG